MKRIWIVARREVARVVAHPAACALPPRAVAAGWAGPRALSAAHGPPHGGSRAVYEGLFIQLGGV